MSYETSRRKLIKVTANVIEDWKFRVEYWPTTLLWTLAGFAVGLSLAFLTAGIEIVRSLLVMHHLQLVEPALIWTQAILWPVSPSWWYYPAMGDEFWWRGVFGNATIFA